MGWVSKQKWDPSQTLFFPSFTDILTPGCLSDNIMLWIRGSTENTGLSQGVGIAVLLPTRNQGWTLGKSCNGRGQQGLSEKSAEPPVFKPSTAGGANTDRDHQADLF